MNIHISIYSNMNFCKHSKINLFEHSNIYLFKHWNITLLKHSNMNIVKHSSINQTFKYQLFEHLYQVWLDIDCNLINFYTDNRYCRIVIFILLIANFCQQTKWMFQFGNSSTQNTEHLADIYTFTLTQFGVQRVKYYYYVLRYFS